MSRQKVSKETALTERGFKINMCETTGNKKNGAKRKPCQENEMWREENVKRRRSQEKEMPKDKDAKRKRRQRKAAETTSVSRDSDDIRKRLVRREECVKSLAPELSTRRAVKIQKCPGASRIKRKWQHQTKMSRARNVKDKDFQEITQSTAVPARQSGVVPIGSPLSLYRFFPLSKLPSPGLPGLYLCDIFHVKHVTCTIHWSCIVVHAVWIRAVRLGGLRAAHVGEGLGLRSAPWKGCGHGGGSSPAGSPDGGGRHWWNRKAFRNTAERIWMMGIWWDWRDIWYNIWG